jgi:glycosyltransferase involved in cell wall biosynthesis
VIVDVFSSTDSKAHYTWFLEFENQLLRIKEPNLTLNLYRLPSKSFYLGDIGYYLHAGLFKQDTLRSNLIKVVHMHHPQDTWEYVYKYADHLVFQSKRYYDQYDKPNKSLISMAVDSDVFKPNIKIGIVAILQKRKNVELLEEIVNKTSDTFKFYICGDRWEETFINHPKVVKLGHRPYERMPDFYHSIDYLLITSDMEGGPYVLLEVKACGKQVITTDVGYAGEVPCLVYKDLEGALEIFKTIETQQTKDIENFKWDNFRDKHVNLFKQLCK